MSGRKGPPVFGMALLVAGAAVGAGILGLPSQTGFAGFTPSLVGLVLLGAGLLLSALVIAWHYMAAGREDIDLPTLFHEQLGPWGLGLVVVGYFLNFYGIMVAYLAGAGSVLAQLLGHPESQGWLLWAFFLPATLLTVFGLKLVSRANALIMVLLVASFVCLLVQAGAKVEAGRLYHMDWVLFPSILPIIMCSLSFHNMVPLVCRGLKGERGPILKALSLGMAIPVLICLLWVLVVLGAVPLEGKGPGSLLTAFTQDQPATVPLSAALNSPYITLTGMVFSLCAIFTSYLGVGIGLMNFWGDLWPRSTSIKSLRVALTFLPPLLVVNIWPELFLIALNLSGGLGVALIFGVAPALLVIKGRPGTIRPRPVLGWLMLLFFGGMVCLELLQEFGFLAVNPQVEHFTSGM